MSSHCLRPHLVNDDTDVMPLSSLSSLVCPPPSPPSSKLSRGQSYQVAAQEAKERCSLYQVASSVCDAAPSPTAAVARCEASGSSQSVSLYCPQQVRQRRCRAKTRESPGYVVTGDTWTRKWIWVQLAQYLFIVGTSTMLSFIDTKQVYLLVIITDTNELPSWVTPRQNVFL